MRSDVEKRVMSYFDSCAAGSEATIASAIGATSTEVFLALTVLLDVDKVELYQNQAGDEMYRRKPIVHLEQQRKRICESPTWDVPMHLEQVWKAPVADVAETALPPATDKPIPVSIKATKRKKPRVVVAPDQEKELSEDEYNDRYYQSL